MANAMLEDDFKSSHQDLGGMVVVSIDQIQQQQHHHQEGVEDTCSPSLSNPTSLLINDSKATTTITRGSDDSFIENENINQVNVGSSNNNIHNINNNTNNSGMRTLAQSKTRKSVDFLLQPTAVCNKRTKLDTITPTVEQLVRDICTSISRKSRWEMIHKVKDALDHDMTAIHNDEIHVGVDAALTKHLTFLLYQTKMTNKTDADVTELWEEIGQACDAMECVFRASSHVVGMSFEKMGRHLLYLIVECIDCELDRRVETTERKAVEQAKENSCDLENTTTRSTTMMLNDNEDDCVEPTNMDENDDDQSNRRRQEQQQLLLQDTRSITPTLTETASNTGTPEGDLLLRKATKTLGHLARYGDATKPMAHFHGLLGCLVSLISVRPFECIPWEARLSALWTIANLACSADNMQLMLCTPGLVSGLVDVANRPLHAGAPIEYTMEILRSRSTVSRALLNLSWAPENKVVLADHNAVVDLLADLAIMRELSPLSKSRTVREVLEATRRHAVGAIRNLAAAPKRTKLRLCRYQTGRILDVLTDAALNDNDSKVKDRAFAAIHNLAIQDTAELLVNRPALVLALKDVFQTEEENGEHDDGTPKSHASATLRVLERTITHDMPSYGNLRGLLEAANPTQANNDENDDDDDEKDSDEEEEDLAVVHATAV